MAKWSDLRVGLYNPQFFMRWINILICKKFLTHIIDPAWHASWSKMERIWSTVTFFCIHLFFSIIHTMLGSFMGVYVILVDSIFFFKNFLDYIVDYIYAFVNYIIVLLIMNLYFVIDIVNLWSMNFLMCLSLNISLWTFLLWLLWL